VSDEPLLAGGVQITAPSAEQAQLNMFLWGDTGSGKTTLAATAPGKKLLLLLDPGGALSLVTRDDVSVLDVSSHTHVQVMGEFRKADPYGLNKLLTEHPEYETVILDSLTSLSYLALQDAVQRAGGSRISLEQPGINGYAHRNASVVRVTTQLMRLCGALNRHFIVVTHEGSGNRNEEGVLLSVSTILSENTANQIGLKFNEVWHVSDNGKERIIAVRPCRLRKPMKTRLFGADKPEFVWDYDPDTQVGAGIAEWYRAWQDGGGKRLPLPTRVTSTTSKGGVKK
jgi:hypothetical protein